MDTSEQLAKRFHDLAEIAARMVAEYGQHKNQDRIPADEFHEWCARSATALRSTVGEQHTYTMQFEHHVRAARVGSVRHGLGILRGLEADIREGYLSSLGNLIAADVFDDFLEMADHLIEAGHVHAAASLIGAVLEDSLRRLAQTHPQAEIRQKEGLDDMAKKLVQVQAFNSVMKKRIDFWREVRNAADHGRFGDVRADDVRDMLKGVQEFVATYVH